MTKVKDLIENWGTERFEILNTRISDFNLRIGNTLLKKYIDRLYRELNQKGIRFKPKCYLSNEWGCTDGVPTIGIPFYLSDEDIAAIEEEITGDLEDESEIMYLLRHETGHAINYAYRLYRDKEWRKIFGPISKPYREKYRKYRPSRRYVRTKDMNAQKHPDEDFAETFAVWLTPKSNWQKKYRKWGAYKKLLYIDKTMKKMAKKRPIVKGDEFDRPVEELDYTLLKYYQRRGYEIEDLRKEAHGYFDDDLIEIFEPVGKKENFSATKFIKKHQRKLIKNVSHWTGEWELVVRPIVEKFIKRTKELELGLNPKKELQSLVELTALITTVVMNFSYTGRFTLSE